MGEVESDQLDMSRNCPSLTARTCRLGCALKAERTRERTFLKFKLFLLNILVEAPDVSTVLHLLAVIYPHFDTGRPDQPTVVVRSKLSTEKCRAR